MRATGLLAGGVQLRRARHPQRAPSALRHGDGRLDLLAARLRYQVACHLDKPDKCIAVRQEFASIRGQSAPFCLSCLDGAEIEGCGSGSRVGRAVLDLDTGESLTVVHVHGTSGLSPEDEACRLAQLEQVFLDLDGAPGANGSRNIVLGDLNTDPGRVAEQDASAALWASFVGPDGPFVSHTESGPDAEPTYAGLFNIDHVASDAFDGGCVALGITEGTEPVTEIAYFDHRPIVCRLFDR